MLLERNNFSGGEICSLNDYFKAQSSKTDGLKMVSLRTKAED